MQLRHSRGRRKPAAGRAGGGIFASPPGGDRHCKESGSACMGGDWHCKREHGGLEPNRTAIGCFEALHAGDFRRFNDASRGPNLGESVCKDAGSGTTRGDWHCKHACRIHVGGDWHCKEAMAVWSRTATAIRRLRSTARRDTTRFGDAGPGLTVGDCRYKNAVAVLAGGDGPCKLPVVAARAR